MTQIARYLQLEYNATKANLPITAKYYYELRKHYMKTHDRYCLWPDGTFCEENDLEEYLSFMSDDFTVVYDNPEH